MYSTEGMVLKKVDIGETDALFTLYTKEFGKIRGVAQGVKKEDAKLKGHLEPLNLTSINFVLGRGGERLTGASLVNFWPAIRADYDRLSAAWQMAGLVDELCFPGQKDEKIWEEIIGGFNFIENSGSNFDSDGFYLYFQKRLAASLGYGEESDIMYKWASLKN